MEQRNVPGGVAATSQPPYDPAGDYRVGTTYLIWRAMGIR